MAGDGSDAPAADTLARLDAPPVDAFAREWLRPRRPVVLRGVTAGWRAPAEWTPARMAAAWGEASVIAAALERGTLPTGERNGVVFERVALGDYVASLAAPGSARHYVMAPTWNFPPAFARDYRVPPYCAGAAHLRAKVWVGKAGTVTPVHRDVPHNLHVHLTGRKRWLLYPPAASAALYPCGLLSRMPNFAQVDPEHPDYARHPRFRDVAPVGGIVEPGETLFIPSGWWHHTRTLDDAVSMNFWWGGPLVRAAALASTLFKRLRGIRRDEWA